MTTDHSTPYVLLGAGGHAGVLVETLAAAGFPPPAAVLDSDAARHGSRFFDVVIAGSDVLLADFVRRGVRHFVLGIGSAGNTQVRRAAYERAVATGAVPLGVGHPTAFTSPSAVLGAGVQRMPRAIVHTRAVVGDNVLVNTSAVVEHDCRIGDHAHLATGCVLAGNVVVGCGVHVGAGAVVRQGITIGGGAVVGAGAVVVQDVPPLAVVAGVPAKVLRFLDVDSSGSP